MLDEMPSSIFYRWFDHYMEEPWGYEMEMYQHAEVCTYLVNGLYHPKEPVKISDFYPNKEKETVAEEQTWQEQKAILRSRWGG
jgi:hypothetical protein